MAEDQIKKGGKAADAKVDAPAEAPVRDAGGISDEEWISHAKEYLGVQSHVVAGGIAAYRATTPESEGNMLTEREVRAGVENFRNHEVKFDNGEGAQG